MLEALDKFLIFEHFWVNKIELKSIVQVKTVIIWSVSFSVSRIDLAHFDKEFLKELWRQKLNSSVAVLYITCLFVHLSTANYDDKLSLMSYKNSTFLTNVSIFFKLVYRNVFKFGKRIYFLRSSLMFCSKQSAKLFSKLLFQATRKHRLSRVEICKLVVQTCKKTWDFHLLLYAVYRNCFE